MLADVLREWQWMTGGEDPKASAKVTTVERIDAPRPGNESYKTRSW